MKIEQLKNGLKIVKENSDKKIYSESVLMHKIKVEANKQLNLDLIKKLGYKDGHLIDDYQYILRDRKHKYLFFDNHYAVRKLTAEYNEGECSLLRFEL
jgi:hypothetical protein